MKNLFMLLTVLVLSACGSVQPKPITEYKTVLVTPEDAYLTDCTVTPPPKRELYLAAQDKEKERLLFEHAHSQMKNLFTCNERLKALRDWKQKQSQLFDTEKVGSK